MTEVAIRCPDCRKQLAAGETKCRCGWVLRVGSTTPSDAPRVKCQRCPELARVRRGDQVLCFSCEADLRHEESRKFCEANGLRTIDEMREFCKQKARTFGHHTFERWCDGMTQRTVDIIERMDGTDSKTLERLRDAGVIDGRNKLIPLGEAREIAKEARMRERAKAIVEMQDRKVIEGGTGTVA